MLLEFEGVSYTYPCQQQPAIADLNLAIAAGQACALVGRNGCGKTTLFRLANGLYRPQCGSIRWQGTVLDYRRSTLRHLRQQVGLVFQDPEQQLVATTVAGDLAYGLYNHRLPETEIAQRVQQALQDFELLDLADRPVNYLSLGQKKRLAIADVMVLQPKLLLLDEPMAYLDPPQRRNLCQLLARIRAAGTTVAIATHDLDFAEAWADWVLVLESGRLAIEGPPDRVFTAPPFLELGLGQPLAATSAFARDRERLHKYFSSGFI